MSFEQPRNLTVTGPSEAHSVPSATLVDASRPRSRPNGEPTGRHEAQP